MRCMFALLMIQPPIRWLFINYKLQSEDEKSIEQDKAYVENTLLQCSQLPALNYPDERSYPSDILCAHSSRSYDGLVELRQRHETAHAASIARVRGHSSSEDQGQKSQRMEIVKGFHEILWQQQACGVGTKKEQSQRWLSSSSLGMRPADLIGNAAEAASKAAAKVRSV